MNTTTDHERNPNPPHLARTTTMVGRGIRPVKDPLPTTTGGTPQDAGHHTPDREIITTITEDPTLMEVHDEELLAV